MNRGSLWGKMVASGARLKYIKYFIKLNWLKKSDKDQPKQIESNSDKLINKKIEYNKFGFPIDINQK